MFAELSHFLALHLRICIASRDIEQRIKNQGRIE